MSAAKRLAGALAGFGLLLLGACGSNSAGAPAGASIAPVVNTLPIVVDSGISGFNGINLPSVTVRICAPGSTAVCQNIDHVLLDTGSSGLRIMAGALGPAVLLSSLTPVRNANEAAITECVQFADGYTFGSVRQADVYLAGEIVHALSIQVMGDPAYSNAVPQGCSSAIAAYEEDSPSTFGANGVLGVSNLIADCGQACASGYQSGASYSACAGNPPSCTPTTLAVADQVSNPVAAMAADNNGVIVSLSAVPAVGMVSSSGTLTFGINTQEDNALGGATLYQLNPEATLTTTIASPYVVGSYSQSFFDTGSNGIFFPSTIPTCVQSDFYCPASTLSLSATISGNNAETATLDFFVANASAFISAGAAPDLAGSVPSGYDFFDWGLPFFFGRSVYVGLETTTLNGVSGPITAF